MPVGFVLIDWFRSAYFWSDFGLTNLTGVNFKSHFHLTLYALFKLVCAF